jgi:hypothetical protein
MRRFRNLMTITSGPLLSNLSRELVAQSRGILLGANDSWGRTIRQVSASNNGRKPARSFNFLPRFGGGQSRSLSHRPAGVHLRSVFRVCCRERDGERSGGRECSGAFLRPAISEEAERDDAGYQHRPR